MIGELVDGRYEIEEVVASGGMATVFKARDVLLERTVALKVLQEEHSSDPEYVERFRREAQAMAKIAHPNVVTVIDRGEFEGRQYIVFEYLPGETLKDVLQREGRLRVADALAVAHQVARALAFAHERGVVHRDVKPQNVLIDENATPRVTDFGIARALGAAGDAADTLTKAGTVLGTSEYMAPEQALGHAVDERSDQYSLGVLLYELLTGEVPYRGNTFMAVAARHVRDPVPSVRRARRDVSPRVDALVRRALAKRPQDRFPSMAALVAALEACLAGEAAGDGPRDVRLARPLLLPWPVHARALLPFAAAAAVVVAGVGILLAGASDVVKGDVRGKRERPAAALRLVALRDHDPFGDGEEHAEDVRYATDGDRSTYWTTERYSSFEKRGVGIVLDAGESTKLRAVHLVSDEPGFRAKILAGNRANGGFRTVSREREVAATTAFKVTAERAFRYWVVWITDPNGRAHVNEVKAR